ncbi:hypothetical protein [Streptomyces sp. NPDC059489]|uniref:hypothetical protein n=1 Tax=Streptomyces sp. NPDC059489 TaxID=3346849 RepID=UPI00367CAAA3
MESVHGFPLKGWARQLSAIDFNGPDEQPERVDSELAEAIDRLDVAVQAQVSARACKR